jgi:hypothetical protein
MADNISELERWYFEQGNGEWEHGYGVSIGTLDNPGWVMKIDLNGTKAENRTLDRVELHQSEDDWPDYRVVANQFVIHCGPQNLSALSEYLSNGSTNWW